MSEAIDYFEQLEKEVADIKMPEFPDTNMETYITNAIDPIVGAQLIQQYIETQSPEAQEQLIRKYLDILNFHFMSSHLNCQTDILVEDTQETPCGYAAYDMHDVLIELSKNSELRMGGKMNYFEKHFYTNEQTGITRPIVSLRLHSGAFQCPDEDGRVIGIENYATVPITAIIDYRIQERD